MAYLPHAGAVPVSALRRLACDADIIPIVLGSDGAVLDMGRRVRLATPAQRRALIARDGGCLFPGCSIPATWTEAHHVQDWALGGSTDVTDMVLLCAFHHHAVHKGRWAVRPTTPGDPRDPIGPIGPIGQVNRPHPYRITPVWADRPGMTWNPYRRIA